jgi:hypothetical protein
MKGKIKLLAIGLGLLAASILVANVSAASAASNLNSSKSNVYKTTGQSLEPVQAKINELKNDPTVKNIKIDCIVKTNPFSIECTISWRSGSTGPAA